MKALLRLNPYLWKYKYHFFLGILFISLSNFFALYPAALIRQVLDMVMANIKLIHLYSDSPLEPTLKKALMRSILFFSVVIIGMALMKGVFMFFMRQTLIVMSRHIEYDMKNAIYAQYQRLNLAFFKTHSTGDLMNRISEDVGRVRMYTGPAIMYSINLLVMFALVIYQMVSVNIKLTLFVLLPLPVLALAVYLVNSSILRKSERVQEQLSRLSAFVQEAFSGIRILKAYNRLKYYGFEFEKGAEDYQAKNLGLVQFNAVFFPLIMLLVGLSTLLTIYLGGLEVARGTISGGVIAEFIIYINMLTWPVAAIGWVTSMMQRAAASQKRINEFMDLQPEIVNTREETASLSGRIEFRNVSFTYPDTGIRALHGVSFVVEPGQTLAVLGRTGAGKSTVVQLINRFYDVSEGEITIDGMNIREHNLHQLRRETGYVPQEVFLFSDTIRNNIAFGLHELATDPVREEEMVIQAARDADVYENIMGFPEGFDTRIGERGITLSGGQKQRISIARAIIKQPTILVFDDCLSAVDTETEEKILRSLLRIMKGRTSILVSHRISTVKTADHILVLDEGHVAESGSHAQLMEQRGAYYDLYQQQLRDEARELAKHQEN